MKKLESRSKRQSRLTPHPPQLQKKKTPREVQTSSVTLKKNVPPETNSLYIQTSLLSRVLIRWTPTWIQNGYTASLPFLGFDQNNRYRTVLLISSISLELVKTTYLSLKVLDQVKSIESVISDNPIDIINFDNSLKNLGTFLLLYVCAHTLSDTFLKKFVDSLATAIKTSKTIQWIEGGANNGIHCLQLKKTEVIDPTLVLVRDTSQFVHTTFELLDNLISTLASFLTAISIFSAVYDAQTFILCGGILFIVKIFSYLVGTKLRESTREQKRIEGEHITRFNEVTKFSEAIELCKGNYFESKALNNYLKEVEIHNNSISSISGLISFTTELTSFGSLFFAIVLCREKIISGTLDFSTVRAIGTAVSPMVNAVVWNDSKFTPIVRTETAYEQIKLMDFIVELWQKAIAKRDKNFKITKSGDGRLSFKGTIKDPRGKVLFSGKIILEPGKSYEIIGPSGAGKTTIIRALAGIWPYVEGELSIPENICVIPQTSFIGNSDATLLDIMLYPRTSEDATEEEIKKIKSFMSKFNLEDKIGLLKVNSLKKNNGKEVKMDWGRLSGGEKQRISIIRALMQQPKPALIILDEFTSAIDPFYKNVIDQEITEAFPAAIKLFIDHNADNSNQRNRPLSLTNADINPDPKRSFQLSTPEFKIDLKIQEIRVKEVKRFQQRSKSLPATPFSPD